MAKIVELIYTTELRGEGVYLDPVRRVEQWFDKDGTLIFELDAYKPKTRVQVVGVDDNTVKIFVRISDDSIVEHMAEIDDMGHIIWK